MKEKWKKINKICGLFLFCFTVLCISNSTTYANGLINGNTTGVDRKQEVQDEWLIKQAEIYNQTNFADEEDIDTANFMAVESSAKGAGWSDILDGSHNKVELDNHKAIYQKGSTKNIVAHMCACGVTHYLDIVEIRAFVNNTAQGKNVYKTDSWWANDVNINEYTIAMDSSDLKEWITPAEGNISLSGRKYSISFDVGNSFPLVLYDDGIICSCGIFRNYITQYRYKVSTDSDLTTLSGKWTNMKYKGSGSKMTCENDGTLFGYSNGYKYDYTAISATIPDSTQSQYIYVETKDLCGNVSLVKKKVSPNLFKVSLTKDSGVKSVSGADTYKVGASVVIDSTLNTGYHWSKWTGDKTTSTQKYTFNMESKNVSMKANSIINTSTLKVNPNGGTWGGSTATQSFNQNYNTTKSIPVPTRTGYTFTGWTKSSSFYGKMSTLTGSATYTYGATDNVTDTITASWRINTSTLKVNPNGGTWGGSTATQSFEQNYNTTKAIAVPTRPGYTFTGWTKSSSFYGKMSTLTGSATYTYCATDNVTDTITANWRINTSTLKINPNGGNWGGSTAIKEETRDYNTVITVSIPKKEGQVFAGWTKSNPFYGTLNTNTSYTFGAQNGVISTLTATWRPIQSTLRINPNGGTWNGSTNVQDIKQNLGTTLNIPVPTRTGWKFKGWIKSNPFYGTLSSSMLTGTYTYSTMDGVTSTIIADWEDITPPVSQIEPVKDSNDNYTTDTYVNTNNGKMWFKDYLDAQITSTDNETGIKVNYLSDANSLNLVESTNNPYNRYYPSDVSNNGQITLLGHAIDNAGNEGKDDVKSYYVDGTAPFIGNVAITDSRGEMDIKGASISLDENGAWDVDIMESSTQMKGASRALDDWKNTDIKVTMTISDTQSGLGSAVLEKYNTSDNTWLALATKNYNGEIMDMPLDFTIVESGTYRVAVYDKFGHVSYSTDGNYFIDKIPPTVTIERSEYGWINTEVPLHFTIGDNVNGSKIDTLTLVKMKEDGTEEMLDVTQRKLADGTMQDIPITKTVSEDGYSATVDVIIAEEGITSYRLYARDGAGNESYAYVLVKIDYTAPTGTLETGFNESDSLDFAFEDVVEDLSGCDLSKTYFTITDTEAIVPTVLRYTFDPANYGSIHTGVSFYMTDIDVMTSFESCNTINVEFHLWDIAGNEMVCNKQVDIFRIKAELYRYLSNVDGNDGSYENGNKWRVGESGCVKVDAGSFIDRIEVFYPQEWIDNQTGDETYPLDRFENVYSYPTKTVTNHENDDFMIPTAVDDNKTYTIIVKAFKTVDGVEKVKEVRLLLATDGSILDNLKTRVRYKH